MLQITYFYLMKYRVAYEGKMYSLDDLQWIRTSNGNGNAAPLQVIENIFLLDNDRCSHTISL